jgi:sigma-E factor negative regulatory protein RseB
MKRFVLACLFASHCLSALAEELEQDPWQVLARAAQAARDLSYKGIFTYQTMGKSNSVEITHMNTGQGEYAHVVMLDGSPKEMLAQGRDLVIFNPKHQKIVIEKRRGKSVFPAILPSDLESIKALYYAKYAGTDRVGGREGLVVMLEAKDNLRYHYRLCADKEFGILLKVTTSNQRHENIEQVAFNQLNLFSTENMAWFHPKVDAKKAYVMEEPVNAPSAGDNDYWKLSNPPNGYKQVDHYVRKVPGKLMPVNQFIYTDGLSSVSLFIEPLTKGVHPKVGKHAHGATSAFISVANGHQITAVGEVPLDTVENFVNTVSFNK